MQKPRLKQAGLFAFARSEANQWRENAQGEKEIPETGDDARNLAMTPSGHANRHQQRDIAHFARPGTFHDNVIGETIRVIAFDLAMSPFVDLGVDLPVQLRHGAQAETL